MNKILIMGKFTVEKHHWKAIKNVLKIDKTNDVKFSLVNKPDNYILTKGEVQEYVLVITTQSNPLVLKNIKKVLGDVPLLKPYKNKNKELTHFMVINEIVVDYKYELVELDKIKPNQSSKKFNKKKDLKPKQEDDVEVHKVEAHKSLDDMLKVLEETPYQEKPKSKKRKNK